MSPNGQLREARVQKTRPTRIQIGGKIHGFGRRPPAEARRIEDAKREEYARTGKVTGARSVHAAPGYLAHRDDPVLWASDQQSRDEDEIFRERALMLAVFEDAIACLSSKAPKERLEAERWIATNDRSYLYAFASICDVFGLDLNATRQWARTGEVVRARKGDAHGPLR